MDRRKFAKIAGAGTAGTILAAPAIAQSSPEIKWRWVSSFPKTAEASWPATVAFTRRVSELTDGKFQIQLFGPNELVQPLQVLDAVQQGTVEAGFTASYFYVGKDPTFAFASALPFGLNTRQHLAWMNAGGGGKLMNDFYADYGVTYVGMGLTGAQMGGWYRKEIKTVGDLKGLKIRIGGFGGNILAKLGVVPQLLAAGDTYAALERGVLDAAEYTNPVDDEQMGLHKVAKFYYYPGWWEPTVQVGHFINRKKWEELPERYRIAIQAVSAEQEQVILNGYDAKNAAALKRLVGQGVQLKAFPREIMQAGYKAAFEYYDELAEKNPKFKAMLSQYMTFRNDALLWHRIAEAGYDNFVQAEWARTKR
ncbi:MAG TPA: TRAP transporter substrate-binding protein DctP [Burkholderiaceae bacterium]|nr:TRAP transporter substrate-binding protein DctP [Burkholderiaceae bacterium]